MIYLAKKLSILFLSFIGITVIAFGLIRMVPGDPVLLLIGERGVSNEKYEEMKANLGLNQPIWKQYYQYLYNVAHGDLGTSIVSKRPVAEEFFSRFPATIELGFMAIMFAIIVGIPAGMIAAVRRKSFLDYSIMGLSLVGYSMPIFWWGLLLIMFFSVQLGLTPVSGRISPEFDIQMRTGFLMLDTLLNGEDQIPAFLDALHRIMLPAICMGTVPLAAIARITRSSMLEVLGEDYIRTAKAKGLTPFAIVVIHGLRNALIPIVTIIGLMVGSIVTGAILTETIFSWPGIGKWLLASITSRDYPVVQGGILCIATIIIGINALVDVICVLINPKLQRTKSVS